MLMTVRSYATTHKAVLFGAVLSWTRIIFFGNALISAEELDAERGTRVPAVFSVPPQSRRGGPDWSVPIPQTQSRPTCGTCTQPRRAQPPLGRAARPGHRPARRVLPPALERRSGPRGGRSRPEQGGDGVSR